MKDIDPVKIAGDSIEKIKKGAFLTVKDGNNLNTMTIGWATIGVIWNKPVMMVAIRPVRHTYGIIEKSGNFTVTIPFNDMKKEIAVCGSRSGRDVNKFEICSLETADARTVGSPVIKTAGRHYECKIVYKTPMNPASLDKEYESFYPQKDYHTLYFGEILACYETQ